MRGLGQHPRGVGWRNLLPVIHPPIFDLGHLTPGPMTKLNSCFLCSPHAWQILACLWLALTATPGGANDIATVAGKPLSPIALAASADGATLFIACATADRVDTFDRATRTIVRTTAMPAAPSGLALSTDGARL